jgi:hypothetical protein
MKAIVVWLSIAVVSGRTTPSVSAPPMSPQDVEASNAHALASPIPCLACVFCSISFTDGLEH